MNTDTQMNSEELEEQQIKKVDFKMVTLHPQREGLWNRHNES